jgi:type II secretory pathway component PulM
MKQLVDLLQELEQNNRIDIKNLDITKSKKQATIDVQIIITTLQQKIETSEETE